jgi:hypothetical protein
MTYLGQLFLGHPVSLSKEYNLHVQTHQALASAVNQVWRVPLSGEGIQ